MMQQITNLRKQWNDTCKAAGIVSIGKDTAAKLLAVVYFLGGEREAFTHNEKLKADLEYIQDVYGFKGGETPHRAVATRVKFYADEIEQCDNGYPEWASKLMKENYSITL